MYMKYSRGYNDIRSRYVFRAEYVEEGFKHDICEYLFGLGTLLGVMVVFFGIIFVTF